MSAQTNFNKIQDAKLKKAEADRMDKKLHASMTPPAIMAAISSQAAINLPHPHSNWIGGGNQSSVTIGPAYNNGGLVISNGTAGTLGTNSYGGLTWNGSQVGGFDKPTVSRVSEMMKDGLSREIVLCESREECKEKYGSYGVKLFDSMLNEVLQEAIKSEEAFNLLLQTEHEKTSKLKEFIINHMGMTDEARHLFISLMLS